MYPRYKKLNPVVAPPTSHTQMDPYSFTVADLAIEMDYAEFLIRQLERKRATLQAQAGWSPEDEVYADDIDESLLNLDDFLADCRNALQTL